MDDKGYFTPYEGPEPYIFISYAHADQTEVLRVVEDMSRRGFRLWYDEGIEAGSEWTECIADHLAGAALMLGFVTDNYMASANCRREMNFAVQKKIKVLNIFLSPTTLTPGMELQIGGVWALMKYTYPSEEYFYAKLYEAPMLRALGPGEAEGGLAPARPQRPETERAQPRPQPERPHRVKTEAPPTVVEGRVEEARSKKKKKAGRIVAVSVTGTLLTAIIALLLVGYFTGFLGRMRNKLLPPPAVAEALPADTVAAFKSPVLEAAARVYCGKVEGDVTVGDLAGLTELYVFGGMFSYSEPYEVGSAVPGDEYTGADGESVARGSITDLSDLAYFPSLTTVQLSFQSLSSLESLPACNIRTLIVSANRLVSLKGVGALPVLTALDASHNPIADAGDISSCAALASVDLTGASITDWKPLRALPALSVLRASGSTFAQLKPVLTLSTLTEVELRDCDLRGDVFDTLDAKGLRALRLYDCALSGLAGADELRGLTELWLVRVSGLASFYELTASESLRTVHIDESMEGYFTGTYAFEVLTDAK